MSNFEDRLLSALKEEITMRKAKDDMTIVTPAPANSRRRLGWLSAAVAGVAAATTVVLLNTGSPAYAVTKGSDGAVSVQINEFNDPDGLEADLAAAGVKAVVDYLPFGQTCKVPRGASGSSQGQFKTSIGKEGGLISFRIEKGQVPAGETLVLAISKAETGAGDPPSSTSLQIVKGAVAPCEVISAPVPPAIDGGVTHEKSDGDPGFQTRTDGENGKPTLESVTE